MHRRNFFQLALGATAVTAASAAVSGRTPEDVATDEDYWSEIRSAFSIDRNFINLNNGYVSPSPHAVQDAMRRYLDYSDMGPYPTMVNVLYRELEAVRRRPPNTPAATPKKSPSPATPPNPSKTPSTASISSPATKSSPPTRTTLA